MFSYEQLRDALRRNGYAFGASPRCGSATSWDQMVAVFFWRSRYYVLRDTIMVHFARYCIYYSCFG